MTAANVVALAATISGYLLYSRLLNPSDFGIYAGALAIAKLGTTILDGGLKIALVKHSEEVTSGISRALFLGSVFASVVGVGLLATVLLIMANSGIVASETAQFFALYGGAYLLTYPFLFIPLAQLEREQRFAPIARAEMLSISLEYGLPALLWLLVAPGFWSFVVSAWLSRGLRTALVLAASVDRSWLSRRWKPEWIESKGLLAEGLTLQVAVSLSMLRDSLHLLLVGPWFGKEWAGLYAWALQMCAVASQVFVQTATRVALPALRQRQGIESRWRATLVQITWLTIFTAPPLVFLTQIAHAADAELFASKWHTALTLLPFLVVRMLPGLATTPLGSLVLAERGARAYAVATAWWTTGEVAVAIVLMYVWGPIGLAWSYSFMAWLGVAAFVRQLPYPASLSGLLPPLLLRPSLWGAVVLVGVYQWVVSRYALNVDLKGVCLYGAIGMLACIAIEHRCWQMLLPMISKRERRR